ncbi:uncharacterized protein E0L32_011994 [Thyridium curvatum]|uniref:Uncharacterized protein n=1 Tax=Thyridium curvatum TaxID=1093900 RepID=A0A507BL79_9PEZI|nr:uncharacterized protein E0L32_011994 [Thyridium curvatum]TPX17931.1 hypothetical protein E0L32_011994 [Thyridium curvatum]
MAATRLHYILLAAAAILLLLGLARQHDQVIDTIKKPWEGGKDAAGSSSSSSGGRRPSFREVALQHGTDKVTTHQYWFMYEKYLEPLREKKLKMLEIGLGCNMGYGPGKSYYTWLEFFPNVDLYYIEYDAACAEKWKDKTSGATIFTGDQADRTFLRRFVQESGGDFDVIIDDGGHSMDQQRNSLEELWGIVKPGALYFVEDLQTSYMGSYGGDEKGGKDPAKNTMTKYIYELIDDRMTDGNRHPISKDMRSIDCMKEVCAITKKEANTDGSALDTEFPTNLGDARRREGDGRPADDEAGKELQAEVAARVLEDGARQRRATQRGEGVEEARDAEPRAQVLEVARDGRQHDERQADDAARREAVRDGEHDVAGRRVDGDPAEARDGRHADDEHDGVQGSDVHGQVRGRQAADGRGGVEDGDEVERHVAVREAVAQRVGLQVEERDEEAEVGAEHGEAVEDVGPLAEGRGVDEGAHAPRGEARAHDEHAEAAGRQRQEAQHAQRPAEADAPQQVLEDERVDDPAQAAAADGDARDEGAPAQEPLRQDGEPGHDDAAGAEADAEPLRQQDVPVLRADARHHGAEGDAEGAHGQERRAPPGVEERARDGAAAEQQEGLDGADPGYRRGRDGAEEVCLVPCPGPAVGDRLLCQQDDARGLLLIGFWGLFADLLRDLLRDRRGLHDDGGRRS